MKNMKKLLSLMLSASMVFSMTGYTVANAEEKKAEETAVEKDFTAGIKKDDIVVLYDNDVHCAVEGYANMAALKKDMLAKTKNVAVVSSGDFVQGATIGSVSQGQAVVDIMNKVGYTAVTLGNHEFDYKVPQLKKLVKNLKCTTVSSNYIKLKNKKALYKPYVIKNYDGTKVAFLGIATPESITKSTPAYFQDKTGKYVYDFMGGKKGKQLYGVVQKNINKARKDGAKYVIALSHLGTEGVTPEWSAENVIKNTHGIDVMLDGHSHSTIPFESVYDKKGDQVILTSTGTKFQNIGELVITKDGSLDTRLISTKEYTKQDPEVKSYIEGVQKKYAKKLEAVIGETKVDLTTLNAAGKREVRRGETNMGDFCADAIRTELDADFAIVNGGGIRANIKKGNITMNDVLSVFPWGNMLCSIKVNGQTIADALEMSARSYPEENGGFLQVSGLKYTIDSKVPSSVKLDDKNMFVKVEGARRVKDIQVLNKKTGEYEKLDMNKEYTVAGINYILKSCGDGYSLFKGAKVIKDDIMVDSDALIKYVQKTLNGTVDKGYDNPSGQGRITIIK